MNCPVCNIRMDNFDDCPTLHVCPACNGVYEEGFGFYGSNAKEA